MQNNINSYNSFDIYLQNILSKYIVQFKSINYINNFIKIKENTIYNIF